MASAAVPKTVALLACGSYNPPTYAHLRMFERARDYLQKVLHYQVSDGIISPVNDEYGKKELIAARHRVKMLQLAVESSDWIKVDNWESSQRQWCRTVVVLRHMREALTQKYSKSHSSSQTISSGTLDKSEGESHSKQQARVMLLCGADLLESFAVPDLWQKEDIEEIVRDFGLLVICRNEHDPHKFVYEHDIMSKYENNIHIVREWITNDISSTKIRKALQRNDSVRYLIPDAVLQYIKENNLYFGMPQNDISENKPVQDSTTRTSNSHNESVDSYADSDYDNVAHCKRRTIYRTAIFDGTNTNLDSHTNLDTTAPPSSVTLASCSKMFVCNGANNHVAFSDSVARNNRRTSLNYPAQNKQSILRKPRPISYHQELSKGYTDDAGRYIVNRYPETFGCSMTDIPAVVSVNEPKTIATGRVEEFAWEYDPEKTKSCPNLKLKWMSPQLRNIQCQQRCPSISNIVVKVSQLKMRITPETTV